MVEGNPVDEEENMVILQDNDEIFKMQIDDDLEQFPDDKEEDPEVVLKETMNVNESEDATNNNASVNPLDPLEKRGKYHKSPTRARRANLSDGEIDCSDDEEANHSRHHKEAQKHYDSRRYDIDDRVRQEIIGQTIAKTMKQWKMGD